MLTKKQFLTILNLILKEEDAQEKFNEALREYAPSDFTGFAKMGILDTLVDFLVDAMEDSDGYISWWLWDAPDRGRNPKGCRIWLGDSDDPDTEVVEIITPEQLYSFLVANYGKAPSKDTIRLAVKSQDNGVKFALRQIDNIIESNIEAKNPGWEERKTLMELLIGKISNEYLLARGTGADLNYLDDSIIISVLEDES